MKKLTGNKVCIQDFERKMNLLHNSLLIVHEEETIASNETNGVSQLRKLFSNY